MAHSLRKLRMPQDLRAVAPTTEAFPGLTAPLAIRERSPLARDLRITDRYGVPDLHFRGQYVHDLFECAERLIRA